MRLSLDWLTILHHTLLIQDIWDYQLGKADSMEYYHLLFFVNLFVVVVKLFMLILLSLAVSSGFFEDRISPYDLKSPHVCQCCGSILALEKLISVDFDICVCTYMWLRLLF